MQLKQVVIVVSHVLQLASHFLHIPPIESKVSKSNSNNPSGHSESQVLVS